MPALTYNADVERYRFLLRWRHTVLPMVVRDPVYWLLMCIHCFFVVASQFVKANGEELPSLDWKASATLGSLLTFFVVFYGACAIREHSWRSCYTTAPASQLPASFPPCSSLDINELPTRITLHRFHAAAAAASFRQGCSTHPYKF